MGNSLAETGLNTEVFGDSAYCFAIAGRDLFCDMKLLERHLSSMPNVRIVILTLHYNLHTDILLDDELMKEKKYWIYNNYWYLNIPINTSIEGWLYRSSIISEQLHYSKLNKTSTDTLDKYGHSRNDRVWTGEKENYNPPNQMNVNKALLYLTEISHVCKDNNVRLIVITPPFPDEWLDECTTDGIENLTIITDSVKVIYPIEYKNYMFDSCFRNDSLYCNWNHLNHYGATLFAERIKKDFGL